MGKLTLRDLDLLFGEAPELVMAAAIREGVELIRMDIEEDDLGGYLAIGVNDPELVGTKDATWEIQETAVRVRLVHVPEAKRFRGLAQ